MKLDHVKKYFEFQELKILTNSDPTKNYCQRSFKVSSKVPYPLKGDPRLYYLSRYKATLPQVWHQEESEKFCL
jgi:hypothetical protein